MSAADPDAELKVSEAELNNEEVVEVIWSDTELNRSLV